MSASIDGKTVLITGAARRIGREIALALAHSGANVVVHYRNSADQAEALVQEIREIGVKAWPFRADLNVSEEVDGLLERVIRTAGPVYGLINNASTFIGSRFASVTLDELMDSIRLEAWVPFDLGRQLAKQSENGHIINMLDTRVETDYDWSHVAYAAGKHLLGLFTRMMAIQLAPDFAVNAVAPGLILPPEGKDRSYLESLSDELPLKRIGDPEYIADAIVFLLRSEFITGQVIYVDGGRHLNEVSGG
ncbi:MAG: SDR family oxidoreductase [Armatimonadota bacterium]